MNVYVQIYMHVLNVHAYSTLCDIAGYSNPRKAPLHPADKTVLHQNLICTNTLGMTVF